jgi:DNA-binding NarL/FixJ family response regulator
MGSLAQVRVLLADSNLMACHLLAQALERQPGFSVFATLVDSRSLLDSLQLCQPDVALIGANLQEGPLSGFSRLPQLRTEFPALPWIILLDRTVPELVVDAFRAGARGVFSRSDSDISKLSKCIRRVVEGQVWADSNQLYYLLEAFSSGPSEREQPRERVAEGMGNREIAQRLNLSEHTVKNYLFRIFEKPGFSNRVELVLYAVAELNQPGAPPIRPAGISSIEKTVPVPMDAAWETAR